MARPDERPVPETGLGLVQIHKRPRMMYWWEEEKLLTERDRAAIEEARGQHYGNIDENAAETELGRRYLRDMALRKYHREEFSAGLD